MPVLSIYKMMSAATFFEARDTSSCILDFLWHHEVICCRRVGVAFKNVVPNAWSVDWSGIGASLYGSRLVECLHQLRLPTSCIDMSSPLPSSPSPSPSPPRTIPVRVLDLSACGCLCHADFLRLESTFDWRNLEDLRWLDTAGQRTGISYFLDHDLVLSGRDGVCWEPGDQVAAFAFLHRLATTGRLSKLRRLSLGLSFVPYLGLLLGRATIDISDDACGCSLCASDNVVRSTADDNKEHQKEDDTCICISKQMVLDTMAACANGKQEEDNDGFTDSEDRVDKDPFLNTDTIYVNWSQPFKVAPVVSHNADNDAANYNDDDADDDDDNDDGDGDDGDDGDGDDSDGDGDDGDGDDGDGDGDGDGDAKITESKDGTEEEDGDTGDRDGSGGNRDGEEEDDGSDSIGGDDNEEAADREFDGLRDKLDFTDIKNIKRSHRRLAPCGLGAHLTHLYISCMTWTYFSVRKKTIFVQKKNATSGRPDTNSGDHHHHCRGQNGIVYSVAPVLKYEHTKGGDFAILQHNQFRVHHKHLQYALMLSMARLVAQTCPRLEWVDLPIDCPWSVVTTRQQQLHCSSTMAVSPTIKQTNDTEKERKEDLSCKDKQSCEMTALTVMSDATCHIFAPVSDWTQNTTHHHWSMQNNPILLRLLAEEKQMMDNGSSSTPTMAVSPLTALASSSYSSSAPSPSSSFVSVSTLSSAPRHVDMTPIHDSSSSATADMNTAVVRPLPVRSLRLCKNSNSWSIDDYSHHPYTTDLFAPLLCAMPKLEALSLPRVELCDYTRLLQLVDRYCPQLCVLTTILPRSPTQKRLGRLTDSKSVELLSDALRESAIAAAATATTITPICDSVELKDAAKCDGGGLDISSSRLQVPLPPTMPNSTLVGRDRSKDQDHDMTFSPSLSTRSRVYIFPPALLARLVELRIEFYTYAVSTNDINGSTAPNLRVLSIGDLRICGNWDYLHEWLSGMRHLDSVSVSTLTFVSETLRAHHVEIVPTATAATAAAATTTTMTTTPMTPMTPMTSLPISMSTSTFPLASLAASTRSAPSLPPLRVRQFLVKHFQNTSSSRMPKSLLDAMPALTHLILHYAASDASVPQHLQTVLRTCPMLDDLRLLFFHAGEKKAGGVDDAANSEKTDGREKEKKETKRAASGEHNDTNNANTDVQWCTSNVRTLRILYEYKYGPNVLSQLEIGTVEHDMQKAVFRTLLEPTYCGIRLQALNCVMFVNIDAENLPWPCIPKTKAVDNKMVALTHPPTLPSAQKMNHETRHRWMSRFSTGLLASFRRNETQSAPTPSLLSPTPSSVSPTPSPLAKLFGHDCVPFAPNTKAEKEKDAVFDGKESKTAHLSAAATSSSSSSSSPSSSTSSPSRCWVDTVRHLCLVDIENSNTLISALDRIGCSTLVALRVQLNNSFDGSFYAGKEEFAAAREADAKSSCYANDGGSGGSGGNGGNGSGGGSGGSFCATIATVGATIAAAFARRGNNDTNDDDMLAAIERQRLQDSIIGIIRRCTNLARFEVDWGPTALNRRRESPRFAQRLTDFLCNLPIERRRRLTTFGVAQTHFTGCQITRILEGCPQMHHISTRDSSSITHHTLQQVIEWRRWRMFRQRPFRIECNGDDAADNNRCASCGTTYHSTSTIPPRLVWSVHNTPLHQFVEDGRIPGIYALSRQFGLRMWL